MNYILYNPKSKNGQNEEVIKNVVKEYEEKGETYEKVSVLEITDYENFFSSVKENDEIVLLGGDGTLNHFVNDVKDININCKLYFYSCGTGNDFFNDVKKSDDERKVMINDYIKNLPTVIVNGVEKLFIDGIGFGIDGYCCEEGDRLQAKSTKPVNYTSIAIKGLLFHYKAPNAKVTVDGVTKEYKRVWLAPTMKGRFYGGGMMIAPHQNRNDSCGYVTNVVLHKAGKLKTLMVFPSIFKGEHIKHTEMCDIRTGHEITVEFDRPTALQIDGETITNVTTYTVKAKR